MIGYGRQYNHLTAHGLFPSKDTKNLEDEKFQTHKEEDLGIYQIQYQKGKINWLFHGIFLGVPIPLPFVIPSRTKRIVVYENSIPISEYRTDIKWQFTGYSCNYLLWFPGLVGCRYKDDHNYFDHDPNYEIDRKRKQSCDFEYTKDLNFSVDERGFHWNNISLTSKNLKRLDTEIQKKIEFQRLNGQNIKVQQISPIYVYNKNVFFSFLAGINEEGKSCSYQGTLNLFGKKIVDYQKLSDLENHLESLYPLTKKGYIEPYLSENNVVWETSKNKITIQYSHFGFILSIAISDRLN